MYERNELTKRLLSEGWKPEDTPPGTRPYSEYEGGWTYTVQAQREMSYETPCGLLVKGSHFHGGYASYQGIHWMMENNNPLVCCPKFTLDFCMLRHPMLWSECYNGGCGGKIRQCACRQTDRPYTYEGSLDEAHDQVWAEADVLWEEFQARHLGRVCRMQSRYNRSAKTWSTSYDPLECARYGACQYCAVLDRELDSKRGNVFYDVKSTHTIKGDWLFPDKEVTSIRKGIKVLDKTASLTICEAIVRYGKHLVMERFMGNHHWDLYFDPSLHYELVNFRAQRQNTRDMMQDLADVAAGIEVVHQADEDKIAKEQKRARKRVRQERRIRSLEKLVLTQDLDTLDNRQRYRIKKYLGEERIEELLEQRETAENPVQVGLFDTLPAA